MNTNVFIYFIYLFIFVYLSIYSFIYLFIYLLFFKIIIFFKFIFVIQSETRKQLKIYNTSGEENVERLNFLVIINGPLR